MLAYESYTELPISFPNWSKATEKFPEGMGHCLSFEDENKGPYVGYSAENSPRGYVQTSILIHSPEAIVCLIKFYIIICP